MKDTKSYILAIYEILKDFSDENHYLSNPDIIRLLHQIYHIDVDYRTVINNIKSLIDFGIDIETYQTNRKGYYLIDRYLEDSEIELLCHCIHSAHYIPEKASKELIQKLSNLQSKYKRNQFLHQYYISNTKKTKNKELLWNIDIISNAIKKKRRISFEYLKYNEEKRLIKKRDLPYIVSPYFIVQENDNLYLLCQGIHHTNIAHYRIDKMRKITILKETNTPLKENFDPYQYVKNKKFMFSDEEIKVHLLCHEKMLDDVIDQFGNDIMIQKDVHNDSYYHVILTSSHQGIIYFSIQYLSFCELIEPKELRNEIYEKIKTEVIKYQK